MTKKILFHGIVFLYFFISTTSQAQKNSGWYAYDQYGGKQKITELKDFILYEQVQEEESDYPARIDSVRIKKRLNDSLYIISDSRRKQAFALMVYEIVEKGNITAVGIFYPSDTLEAVETTYKDQGLPQWKTLTTRWIFSKSKTLALEKAPGYDEVTRDAMMEALSVRKELSPLLTAYLKDHPETKPFYLYRFVELKAQQKFIDLGYNPYKQVPYNFEKQFQDDEEVIKALTAPMSFENE